MTNKKSDQRDKRCVLAVRMTTAERQALAVFANERSLNLSAYVRKVLFEQVRKDSAIPV